MAFAGVPIGKVNAKPAGSATIGAMRRGSIPNSRATPMVTGINRATTAEWLMASVSRIATSEIIRVTVIGLEAHWLIVACESQVAAPDLLIAEPRAMAPPYISSTPQLT